MQTLSYPHCSVHIIDCYEVGILNLETGPTYLGQIVTVQVPEDYCPKRRVRQRVSTPVAEEGLSELGPDPQWDRHSGYLWYDTPVIQDLKDGFKRIMLALHAAGWWDLAEEMYEHSIRQATERSDA